MAAARIIRRLAELLDVTVTSPADGEVLTYDSGTSKWRNEAAGGGTAPTTREEWSSNGVVLSAPETFAWLPWDSSGGPDAVLDATIPAHPTIITAGVYLVSVVVSCQGSNSSYCDVSLYLDRQGFNASQTVRNYATPTGTYNGGTNHATVAFAWYIPAGGAVEVGVDYVTDGVVDAAASIVIAHVQRLS